MFSQPVERCIPRAPRFVRLLEVEHVPRAGNDDELDVASPIAERPLETPRFLYRRGGVVGTVNEQHRRPKRFDQMADEAGIRNIYDMIYGMLSLFAHGNAPTMQVEALLGGAPPIYENMSLVDGCLKCIALVCSNYIEGKPTERGDLEALLKVKLAE